MSIQILILALAILFIGLGVFYWATRSVGQFNVTNLIAWLLIALLPVLLLFSIFPNPGNVGFTLFGFSAGGAVALFAFIWWFGYSRATEAVPIDSVRAEKAQLEAQVKELTALHPDRPKVLTTTEKYVYQVNKQSRKKLVLITGGIENVKGIGAWVSSENTNMQMARFYDRSVSGTLRYLGAGKDPGGHVTDDVIAKELAAKMSGASYVEPATVVVTGSGELRQTNGVEKIFHVASVAGQVGSGYKPVDNIGRCVTRVLEKTADREFAQLNLQAILFPLLSAGTAGGELNRTVDALLTAAIQYLETSGEEGIGEIYFLVWTDVELAACRMFLKDSDRVAAVSGAGR